MTIPDTWAVDYEVTTRLLFFLGILGLLMLLELWVPRRVPAPVKGKRWTTNLTVVALNALMIRIIFPLMAVDVALIGSAREWGLFHQYPMLYSLEVFLGVIILDMAIYLQHVMFHAVPLLWRFHRMHHADIDFDVTTGTRFHPIEMVLSVAIKMGVIVAFGIPALGVLVFEILLNATSMFTHSNLRLPLGFDRVLRWVFVTPDMHRVHHSVHVNETNSNFGFNFSFWDRIYGTYKAQPKDGHLDMTIGLTEFRENKFLGLGWMLRIPFVGQLKNYAINRENKKKP